MVAGLKFARHDLGRRKRGEVVVVTLQGSAANVRLMDSSNFSAYQKGRKHKYIGGLYKRSPVRLQIPSSGHWYVTVDMAGLRGSVRSSATMEPSALPAGRQSPMRAPLSNIEFEPPHAVVADERHWDVFISHASEDKESVARPLAAALEGRGLNVWLDEAVLKMGDSLRQSIDKGISRSTFGVVVLSRSFIRKGWTNHELDGIVSMTVSGKQRMLPIWHEITKDEVMEYSPSLVDRVARSTGIMTVDEIAEEIADVIDEASNPD